MAALIFQLASDALAPLQLETEPIGWDGMRTVYERGPMHGVTLSITLDLTFVKAAAAYLRTVYEGGTDSQGTAIAARGVEGLVTLTVFEQNPNEFRPEEIYRGRLDFTTYVSEERGVTCQFKETSFATTLLTRDDTEVDLLGNQSLSGAAMPAYTPLPIHLHSQQTLQRYRATQDTQAATGQITIGDQDLTSTSTGGSALLRVGFPTVSINEFGIQDGFGLYIGDSFSALNVPLYRAQESGTFAIALGFTNVERIETEYNRIGIGLPSYDYQIDIKYELRITRGNASTTHSLATYHHDGTLQAGSGYRASHDHTTAVTASFTEALDAGDILTLYAEFYVHGFPGNDSSAHWNAIVKTRYNAGAYLTIEAATITAPTTCASLLAHEALSRCVEACTDQPNSLYSEYFGRTDTRVPYAQTGPGALRAITNGFFLRGFPLLSDPAPATGVVDTRKTLTASLRTLYDSFDATDCLGLGIEQRNGKPVVRIEPRAYFYQASETLRLGHVAELKKSVHPDLLYNAAEVGYTRWQSGAANGLDEFNTKRTYALPLTQLKKTYAITSTLIAAGYLIEEARRDRYAAGTTKEGQADADGFVICVRFVPAHNAQLNGFTIHLPDAYHSEQNQGFAPGTTGILSPATAYNLRLSPGRMLRAHGPWLRAGLAAQTDKKLLLGKTEGNAHLVSRRLSETNALDEAQDVPVTELAPPLVLAETYEFTVRLRRGQARQLTQKPYGRISFLDSFGQRKSGYLLRAERTLKGGSTTFTLLRAAS